MPNSLKDSNVEKTIPLDTLIIDYIDRQSLNFENSIDSLHKNLQENLETCQVQIFNQLEYQKEIFFKLKEQVFKAINTLTEIVDNTKEIKDQIKVIDQLQEKVDSFKETLVNIEKELERK